MKQSLRPLSTPSSSRAEVQHGTATRLGFTAIVFWSTTIAFSRSLSEQLGPLTAGASIHFVGGIIGCLFWLFKKNAVRRIVLLLPRPYLLICGSLFIIYGVSLYLAIGLSTSRQQVIEIGIINYLWPGLTLLFSLPILKQRSTFMLLPGLLLSFTGVVLVMEPKGFSFWGRWLATNPVNQWPYVLAFIAAVSWGLYSNFARRFASKTDTGGAIPLFLLLTGLALFLLRFGVEEEEVRVTLKSIAELAYLGLVPTILAYVFWDISVRCGDLNLVAAFSYLTPLLSTIASCFYLQVTPGINILLGCVLVISGALISRRSILTSTEKQFF